MNQIFRYPTAEAPILPHSKHHYIDRKRAKKERPVLLNLRLDFLSCNFGNIETAQTFTAVLSQVSKGMISIIYYSHITETD